MAKAKKAVGATALVALLRGINVGGHRKLPMAELRDLSTKLGFGRGETYIQSGNLVFVTELDAAAAEVALEKEIERRFGFAVDVVVRTASAWKRYAAPSPFPDAETARPHLLLLGLSKRPPKPGAVDALRGYAKAGERIELAGDALWIDYGLHIATSKLTPTVLDRLVGSPVTARNVRTVQKLDEMLRAAKQA